MRTASLALVSLALFVGCSEEPTPTTTAPQPTAEPAPTTQTVPTGTEPALPPPPSDEVCAEAIVVQWQGATGAGESITRTQADARIRAEELLASIETGARDFATVAREDSDARSSGARGGLIGTYSRADWPPQHEAIRDRAFALQTDQISEVTEAPYGWVILHRCTAEFRNTRHVLVRFSGARNAGPEITRTHDEARALAQQIRERLTAPGADFLAIARETSEDGSRERGGEMGWLGRGRLAPAYEESAFTLPVGAISEPIETEFGFHLIQRVQ
ncbi:MAG: peptidyl-prolyl cis-trans isomerase [Deltaproteobacteria bacterium]|nr:peptidyl-prolyl cis-trans isomerase [Deltaproteobacteria bacterium]